MKTLFLLVMLLFANSSFGQYYKVTITGDTIEIFDPVGIDYSDTNEVFVFVEYMPQPNYNIYEYIESKLIYPDDSSDTGLPLRIAVSFIIRKDGSVDSAHIVGKEYDPIYEQEAVRVVNSMPPWKPGKQNGKPVDVYYTVPVLFNSH